MSHLFLSKFARDGRAPKDLLHELVLFEDQLFARSRCAPPPEHLVHPAFPGIRMMIADPLSPLSRWKPQGRTKKLWGVGEFRTDPPNPRHPR